MMRSHTKLLMVLESADGDYENLLELNDVGFYALSVNVENNKVDVVKKLIHVIEDATELEKASQMFFRSPMTRHHCEIYLKAWKHKDGVLGDFLMEKGFVNKHMATMAACRYGNLEQIRKLLDEDTVKTLSNELK